MKKRDIENRIRQSFSAERPALREKVISSCARQRQEPASVTEEVPPFFVRHSAMLRRITAGALCLLLFISGLSLDVLLPDGGTAPPMADTFVYVDVNPSIELQAAADGRIVTCTAANEDAARILDGLTLTGVDMNTALSAILGAMYVGGYLREDANSILISVDTPDEARTNTLLTAISSKIDAVFENSSLDCSIIAQAVDSTAELAQSARENGVSVGKMHLINKIVGALTDFDENDKGTLAAMSIRDLNLIYNSRPQEDGEDDPFRGDISSGEVGGYVKPSELLSMLLPELSAEGTDIDLFEVRALPREGADGWRMVYAVTVRLKGLGTSFTFTVDCATGEITHGLDHEGDSDEDHDFFPLP